MKIFDLVWITTKGSPLWATETVSTYVYKRAFEWTTFDLGYPSPSPRVWFVIVLAAVLTLTWAVPPAREARVLRHGPGWRIWKQLAPARRRWRFYTAFAAGPFVWAAMMSLRTTTEIHRNHFALPRSCALGEVRRRLVQLELRHLFRQLAARSCVVGRGDPDARRRHGGALPCALPVPAATGDLLHPVLLTIIFPPQITIISLFQILVQYGLYNTQDRADAGLRRDPAAADDLHPGELLRAHPGRPVRRRAHGRLFGLGDLLAGQLPIALPAVATTVILNFILLWNEFLYAVVLITDERIAPCRSASRSFIGDRRRTSA